MSRDSRRFTEAGHVKRKNREMILKSRAERGEVRPAARASVNGNQWSAPAPVNPVRKDMRAIIRASVRRCSKQ